MRKWKNNKMWDGKSYDDTIMSPEAFARFLRRRLDEGLSVEGYSYTCTNGELKKDNVNNNCKELEDIISDIKIELEFLGEKYSGIQLRALYESVESLEELLRNEITTPFSDDLGTENNYCYPREFGEVHDTFNVEINQGSGNPIILTRRIIRSNQDDGSYLQSMVDVLSKLRNDK